MYDFTSSWSDGDMECEPIELVSWIPRDDDMEPHHKRRNIHFLPYYGG